MAVSAGVGSSTAGHHGFQAGPEALAEVVHCVIGQLPCTLSCEEIAMCFIYAGVCLASCLAWLFEYVWGVSDRGMLRFMN